MYSFPCRLFFFLMIRRPPRSTLFPYRSEERRVGKECRSRWLRIFAHKNDPANVECKVKIRMVAANIERPVDRTRGQVQDHRETRARLDRQLFERVQKTL